MKGLVIMNLSNEKTLQKFAEFEKAYMYPKQSVVAEKVNINRTLLSAYLHGRRELSYENKKRLNQWLDRKIALVEKETV